MAAVPRVFCDLRHQDVAKLQIRTVGAEVGDAGVPGAEVGDPGHELVGELYLGPPLPPGVLDDWRVGDCAVLVAVTALVGAVKLRRVLAGHDAAKVSWCAQRRPAWWLVRAACRVALRWRVSEVPGRPDGWNSSLGGAPG